MSCLGNAEEGGYHMKQMKGLGIILISSVLLSACGMTPETPEEEGAPADIEENWAQYIQDGSKTLESYASDTDIDLDMSLGEDMMTDEDQVSITMQAIGDLEKGYMTQDGYEMYFEGNDVYQIENDRWVYYEDGGPIDYPSWYPNIVEALTEIEDLIVAESDDGNLELTYEGNDPAVWDAFEEEFALSIDGIAQENITIDLEANVDESFYYLQDLTLDILGKETEGDAEVANISIVVEVDYYDHNEVELTEIGEKIKEQSGN